MNTRSIRMRNLASISIGKPGSVLRRNASGTRSAISDGVDTGITQAGSQQTYSSSRHTAHQAMNLTFPDYVVATGGKFEFTDSIAEIPDTFNVLADYPGGPTMQLISSMANDAPVDHMIRGHKATLYFTRYRLHHQAAGRYMKEMQPVSVPEEGS